MLPLLPRFEFELVVLENASNDLVLAFRDVQAPPALTGSKLSDNTAKLNSKIVFLHFGFEKTLLNSECGRRLTLALSGGARSAQSSSWNRSIGGHMRTLISDRCAAGSGRVHKDSLCLPLW